MSIDLQLQLLERVIAALAIGCAFGLEREWTRHFAGIRTMMLVAVGACLFTEGGYLTVAAHSIDPTRIAAQVVTGVGFLGAGTIFRAEDRVRGLTTAATIWLVAALGMAAGFGLYLLAGGAAVLSLFLIVSLRVVERRLFPEAERV